MEMSRSKMRTGKKENKHEKEEEQRKAQPAGENKSSWKISADPFDGVEEKSFP